MSRRNNDFLELVKGCVINCRRRFLARYVTAQRLKPRGGIIGFPAHNHCVRTQKIKIELPPMDWPPTHAFLARGVVFPRLRGGLKDLYSCL